jgi:5-methylcytosine-specific restriction endonuclease McrA
MSNSFEEDELTILSELTDNSFENNTDFIQNKEEINTRVYNELSKLTSDNLKEKCKSYNLSYNSKSKKQELINLLVSEFNNHWNILKDYNKSNLKQICKDNKLKGFATAKKDKIILVIMNYYADNLIINSTQIINNNSVINIIEKKDEKIDDVSINIIDELERQKKEIEKKMIDEIERQNREAEEIERKQKEEDDKRKKQLEEQKEKEEKKRKKQSIPKNVRNIVWNHYIGEDIIKHKCLCCKKVTITNTNFEVGHVLSEKNGGTHEINNLRPICGACNHSMGTENMIDFVVKYGLYIG